MASAATAAHPPMGILSPLSQQSQLSIVPLNRRQLPQSHGTVFKLKPRAGTEPPVPLPPPPSLPDSLARAQLHEGRKWQRAAMVVACLTATPELSYRSTGASPDGVGGPLPLFPPRSLSGQQYRRCQGVDGGEACHREECAKVQVKEACLCQRSKQPLRAWL